jgi:hypothetical protein
MISDVLFEACMEMEQHLAESPGDHDAEMAIVKESMRRLFLKLDTPPGRPVPEKGYGWRESSPLFFQQPAMAELCPEEIGE